MSTFQGLSTNLDIYVVLRSKDNSDILDYQFLAKELKTHMGVELSSDDQCNLLEWCRKFCFRVHQRWVKARNCQVKFKSQNSAWLEKEIKLPTFHSTPQTADTETEDSFTAPSTSIQVEAPSTSIQVEAPSTASTSTQVILPSTADASCSTSIKSRKAFEVLSERQKRRRVENIRMSSSVKELTFATSKELKSSGQNDIAYILDYLMEHPEEASSLRRVIDRQVLNEISPEKALALMISMKLSKWRYISLREFNMREGVANFPSYYKIQRAKMECYPDKSDITITETSARIKIQALLNITVKRLIKSLNIDLSKSENKELIMISKWGFDGSSDQSVYKQPTSSTGDQDISSVFMASLIPLSLRYRDGDTIWDNEKSSSTFYCRPIMFVFMKETEMNVMNEMASFESEISQLVSTVCEEVSVSHQLILTMIDGKITSYLSGTSSATCDICKAKPTDMNDLDKVTSKSSSEDLYKYGISSLHAWIRSMECFLHIAYRLDFKSWAARGDDKKKMLQNRKVIIQDTFRKEMGLLIDVVKQGSGNTNDGNTARRFFSDPSKTSAIIGVDENLIRRFAVLLQSISSGEAINIDKFRKYCRETAELYIQLYPWYHMPSSIHKLLIHGADIISHLSMIPIGNLSEEASEARNKDFRKFRESHSRKHSSIACNEDILHNLLLSSDPVLSKIRPKMDTKKKKELFTEAKELLIISSHEFEFVDVSHLESDDDTEYDDDEKSDDDSE